MGASLPPRPRAGGLARPYGAFPPALPLDGGDWSRISIEIRYLSRLLFWAARRSWDLRDCPRPYDVAEVPLWVRRDAESLSEQDWVEAARDLAQRVQFWDAHHPSEKPVAAKALLPWLRSEFKRQKNPRRHYA
jgi:hypothetical protein